MAEMTVREAGRKGGMTVREKHGLEFFREIGRKGGQATWRIHGREFYQEIGKKGGQKGGARVRELIQKAKGVS
ncbi:MAG: KGG domain-containing protein [Armatimonadota bacterium]|jgi:general stress protein YciG